MKHIFIALLGFLLAFAPNQANAGDADWKKKLLEDAVALEGEKMVILEYGLLSFPTVPDEKTQMKFYSEAPADSVISRDNFVAITTTIQTLFFAQLAIGQGTASEGRAESIGDLFDFQELDEPIGKADMEFNVYMNKGGLQIEVSDTRTGQTSRSTLTWKEFLDR